MYGGSGWNHPVHARVVVVTLLLIPKAILVDCDVVNLSLREEAGRVLRLSMLREEQSTITKSQRGATPRE
jgi:hypothetical protein